MLTVQGRILINNDYNDGATNNGDRNNNIDLTRTNINSISLNSHLKKMETVWKTNVNKIRRISITGEAMGYSTRKY